MVQIKLGRGEATRRNRKGADNISVIIIKFVLTRGLFFSFLLIVKRVALLYILPIIISYSILALVGVRVEDLQQL